MTNCVIANNGGSADSVGLRIDIAYAIVDNCTISNNVYDGSQGGGVYISSNSTKYATSLSNVLVMRNCLICNNIQKENDAWGGKWSPGGIRLTNMTWNLDTNSGIFNCTIVSNYGRKGPGGIFVGGLSNNIVNCIIASNTSGATNNDILNRPNEASNSYFNCRVSGTNNDSIVAMSQGNITNNPLFADASAGNWRLANNSPCINTGTNQSWMTNSYDLDGRTRIRYGRVDMGAYERIYEATIYGFH